MASVYREYIDKYPDLSTAELAEKIQKSGKVNAKLPSIKRRIRATRSKMRPAEKSPQKEIIAEAIDRDSRNGDHYRIDWDTEAYVFSLDQGKRFIRLPFNVVQSVYEWYSNPNALTVRECVKKLWTAYRVEIKQNHFMRVKNVLGLVHASLPFAPHMYKHHAEHELQAQYVEICEAKLETKIRAQEGAHWHKRYVEEKKKTVSVEMFLERVKEHLIEYSHSPQQLIGDVFDEKVEPCAMVLVLSDWHVGKVVDREFAQYNKEIFWKYIQTLKRCVIEELSTRTRPISSFYVVTSGDLIDGVLGNMHPEQGLNQDLHGAQQVVVAANALCDVVSCVRAYLPEHTDIQVHSVYGNHDRTSSSNKKDPRRFAGQMLFELAKEQSCKGVDWKSHEGVVGRFRVMDTDVYLRHGDIGPTDFGNVIASRKRPGASYHLSISGHRHHLAVREHLNTVHVQCGSFPARDDFAVDHLGVGSRPSQVMIEIRRDGPRPVIWMPLDEYEWE